MQVGLCEQQEEIKLVIATTAAQEHRLSTLNRRDPDIAGLNRTIADHKLELDRLTRSNAQYLATKETQEHSIKVPQRKCEQQTPAINALATTETKLNGLIQQIVEKAESIRLNFKV